MLEHQLRQKFRNRLKKVLWNGPQAMGESLRSVIEARLTKIVMFMTAQRVKVYYQATEESLRSV